MQTQEAESEEQRQTSSKRGMEGRRRSLSRQGDRQKRRKVSQACDQCRTRKTRCDGSRPACHECAVRPYQRESCRYNLSRNQDRNYEDYVSKLLARIRELEQRLMPASGIHHPSSRGTAEAPRRTDTDLRAICDAAMSARSSQWRELPLDSQVEGVCSYVTGPIDAMGAAINPKAPEQVFGARFYGSSSTFSLMQQVYQTVENGLPSSGVTTPLRAQHEPQTKLSMVEPPALSMSFSQPSLLPRVSMDKLLDLYWTRVYHLYPFIHKSTFMSAYEQLWSSRPASKQRFSSDLLGSDSYGPTKIVFHCAMNLMLALATQFMDLPPGETVKLGDHFYDQARNMCKLDLFDDGSLAVIQTLLLMTQYLQSTPFPNRCWNWVGVACRLAQGLGLHKETPQELVKWHPLVIEMRRRVWHACVMLDAVVSMTLGRPLLLYKYSAIPLPVAVDDEYLVNPATQPRAHVSWVQFFIQGIKLYGILADVVSEIYDLSPHPLAPKLNDNAVDRILEVDAAISKLEESLPNHLHWTRHILTACSNENPVFLQQRCVLFSRYLQLRVLLFRPMFIRYCQHMCAQQSARHSDQMLVKGFTPVALKIVRSFSVSCADYSINLIEQLYEFSTSSAIEAWWYNIFYARTAGAIVLLSMACAAMVDAVGWERLTTAWRKCEEVLTNLQSFSRRVSLCLHALQALHQYVLKCRGQLNKHVDTRGDGIAPDVTPSRGDSTSQTGLAGQAANVPPPEVLFTSYENLVWPGDSEDSLFEIFNFEFSQPVATDINNNGTQSWGGGISNHMSPGLTTI